MKPNVLFLLIDAMRFDQIDDPQRRQLLAPTLASLVERGLMVRVVANSHSTKFALPSLFTQTYPLDYGGYNMGIGTRPRSFVEVLQAHGYQTIGVVSPDLNGPTENFERGFDDFHVIYDHRLAVRNFLNYVLLYHVQRWRDGTADEHEVVEIVQRDLGAILKQSAENLHRVPSRSLRRVLWRISPRLARRYEAERELLAREPLTVLHKLATIPPHFYTHYLGRRTANWTLRARHYAAALVGRLQNILRKYSWYKFQLLPFRVPAVAGEVLRIARRSIGKARRPWFCYAHVTDIHDSRHLNRPGNFLRKLLDVPRCVQARERAGGSVPFWTDLALIHVDRQLAKLLRRLERAGQLDNTLILVTADHGNGWDQARDSALSSEFGFRTHYEHLQVPLIIAPPRAGPMALDRPCADGLFDSTSVTATLLDLLGLPQHLGFKGHSIFTGGRRAVVSENAGRGNCDVARRDLYFTVTSPTHKLMVVLEGDTLRVARLYDLMSDPRELNNVADRPEARPAIGALLAELYDQRGELLRDRGVAPPSANRVQAGQ